jgi:hypothetical protein
MLRLAFYVRMRDAGARSARYLWIMARLDSEFKFTGSVGDFIAYRRPGSDEIFLRAKGGVSREKLKRSDVYELTRRRGVEFGGRAKAASWVIKVLRPHKAAGNHNLSGRLTALLMSIQDLDEKNELGKRCIQLSKDRTLLTGFSLDGKGNFDLTVRTPVSFSISREEMSASVDIAALVPHINFFPEGNHPCYSILVVLGMVPDLFWRENGYAPLKSGHPQRYFAYSETPWNPLLEKSPPTNLQVSLSPASPFEFYSLMLSISIRYGRIRNNGSIEPVNRTGGAKVLALA